MSEKSVKVKAYLFKIGDKRVNDPVWSVRFYDKRVVICVSDELLPEPYNSMIPYYYDTKVTIVRPTLEETSFNGDNITGEEYQIPLSLTKSKLLYYIKEEMGSRIYPLLITRADTERRYWYYQIKYNDLPLCICDSTIVKNIDDGMNKVGIHGSGEVGQLLFTSEDLYFNNSPEDYGYPEWYIEGTALDITRELDVIYKEDIIVEGYRSDFNLGIPYSDLVIVKGNNTNITYVYAKYAINVQPDIFQMVSAYMKGIVKTNATLGIFPSNTSDYVIKQKSLVRLGDGKYKISFSFPEGMNVIQDIYEDDFRITANSLYFYLKYYPDVSPDVRKIYIQGESILISIKDSNLMNFLYAIEWKKFSLSPLEYEKYVKVEIVNLGDVTEIEENVYTFIDSQSSNIKQIKIVEELS